MKERQQTVGSKTKTMHAMVEANGDPPPTVNASMSSSKNRRLGSNVQIKTDLI